MSNATPKTVFDAIQACKHVVITTHRNPDGDAIGSSLGLLHALRYSGILCTVILPNTCPHNLQWMPGASTMMVWNGDEKQRTIIAEADAVIVLDLNTLSRLDGLGEAIGELAQKIVNIDHHTHPDDFATVQWIDTESPAVCAMIPKVVPSEWITKDAARCLYTGLMTDTGGFRFPRTTGDIFRLAGELVDKGADPVESFEKTLNVDSFQRSQLLGGTLRNMQRHYDGRLCTMVIRQSDLEATSATLEDTEGFVGHALSINGVQMGILFIELENEVKCSFRSKGDTHVRELAATYGGGGHLHAAGARLLGKAIDEAIDEVVLAAATAVR